MTTTKSPTEGGSLEHGTILVYRRSDFVRGVYRSAGLWALLGASTLTVFGRLLGLSFLVGAVLSIASFWLLELTVAVIVRPAGAPRRGLAMFLSLIKSAILGVVLYFVVGGGVLDLAAFSAGVCVIFFALISYMVYRETAAFVARRRASDES